MTREYRRLLGACRVVKWAVGLGPLSWSVPGMGATPRAVRLGVMPGPGSGSRPLCEAAAVLGTLQTWRPTSEITPVVSAWGGGFFPRPAAVRSWSRKYPPPPSGLSVVAGPGVGIKVMMS